MKILLRNTQSLLGDRLMFTPVVRDLKTNYPEFQIGIISAGPEIWHNNPYIDGSVTLNNADEIYDIGPAKVTKGSKTNGLHITAAFRDCLQEKMNKPIRQGPFKTDVHLSEKEKNHKIIDGRYWVINIDCGPMSAKRWPAENFQKLINDLPEITFVQAGLSKDNQYRLQGSNVIDLIDKTKIRELFSLVYNAEGCISLVSSLMHVAAAFDKPCVVIAGGREPVTFEQYPTHRFIHTAGCLPCCREQACWKNSLTACKDNDGRTAKCMKIIPVEQVIESVKSYYKGGILKSEANINIKVLNAKLKPLLRIVANCKFLGGAERSVIEIARQFINNKWRVELTPAGHLCPDFAAALHDEIIITNHLSRPCDCLLLYASDMVFSFDSDRFKIFERIQAKSKVMALTYKIGKAGKEPWTKGWDKYIFLSTQLRDDFLIKIRATSHERQAMDNAVLAPAVDIKPFLRIEHRTQNTEHRTITIVRHSSQGDKKFPGSSLIEIMNKCGGVKFSYMPGPSWLRNDTTYAGNVYAKQYCNDIRKVAEFLAEGDCFWYLLPEGYTDQGPRVIVEAMAAGLAVIAENRDGARDRVTAETGWLINDHKEAIDIINNLTPEVLEQKGKAARQRAISEFTAKKWFYEIKGAYEYD